MQSDANKFSIDEISFGDLGVYTFHVDNVGLFENVHDANVALAKLALASLVFANRAVASLALANSN